MTMQAAIRLALAATALLAVLQSAQAVDFAGHADRTIATHGPSNPRGLAPHHAVR